LLFRNRRQAGERLAAALSGFKGAAATVFALPRGGVPVAAPIADALAAPLELALVRKIGVPSQPELAMGAVVDGGAPIVVRNEDVIALAGVSDAQFDAVCARECAEIERRRKVYLEGRAPAPVAGRIAIVVDDGVATGATTRAALTAVRARGPRTLILAVPVAPREALAALRDAADEIVCLETPEDFTAIGCHYADFRQVEDAEVVALLRRSRPRD
jgi:putative phosphoribosyl transferase